MNKDREKTVIRQTQESGAIGGAAADKADEKRVLLERLTFHEFYFFGALLFVLGATMTVSYAIMLSLLSLLGLVLVIPGALLFWYPLRQCGMPVELMTLQDDVLTVTDVKRKTYALRIDEVEEIDAKTGLFNVTSTRRYASRPKLQSGYVLVTTKAYGKIKIGYVRRPYEAAASLADTVEKLQQKRTSD